MIALHGRCSSDPNTRTTKKDVQHQRKKNVPFFWLLSFFGWPTVNMIVRVTMLSKPRMP